MSKLCGKKGSIFVQGQSHDSVIKKLNGTALTTAEMLDELVHIYHIKLKAEGEINQLRQILAERLERDEFGLRNVELTSDKLALFVENTRVFEWFAAGHSKVAGRIEAGLRERLAPPMSNAERVRELEEQNRRIEEQNCQLLDLLKNQQNQPHPIPINYPSINYQLPPHKRLQIAEPEQSSEGEESDGRDDNGRDALEEEALEEEVNMGLG
ncbi:hypothetical protein HK104_003961, partial [Borealophlyctis nickersoniae]